MEKETNVCLWPKKQMYAYGQRNKCMLMAKVSNVCLWPKKPKMSRSITVIQDCSEYIDY